MKVEVCEGSCRIASKEGKTKKRMRGRWSQFNQRMKGLQERSIVLGAPSSCCSGLLKMVWFLGRRVVNAL